MVILLLVLSLWEASHSLTANPKVEYPVLDSSEKLLIIGGNTLTGISSPISSVPNATLASLIGKDDINYLFEGKDLKFRQICFCESSFRPAVCSYAGCHSGMGMCGFIPSTWNTTIDRMKELLPEKCRVKIKSVSTFNTDKSHPVFNAKCNVIAAWWLYQTDGERHWYSSQSCWGSAAL